MILMAPLLSSASYHAGPQLDQFVMHGHADAAAHADNHAFARCCGQPCLKMADQIGCDLFHTALAADHRLFARPFGKAFLAVGQFVIFGDLFDLLVENALVLFRELDLGQTALVVDADGRAILDGLLNVVDVYVIAEDRLGVGVLFFNGRARKTDK